MLIFFSQKDDKNATKMKGTSVISASVIGVCGVVEVEVKSGLSRGQLTELHIRPTPLHPRASQGKCNTIWPLSHFAANPYKKVLLVF